MFNIFRKTDQKLIAENEAACQRDDQVMETYVQDMDAGKHAKLTPEQAQAHSKEAAQIEDTRNTLIERGYHRSGGRWQKGN